jgi:hypothetical protein
LRLVIFRKYPIKIQGSYQRVTDKQYASSDLICRYLIFDHQIFLSVWVVVRECEDGIVRNHGAARNEELIDDRIGTGDQPGDRNQNCRRSRCENFRVLVKATYSHVSEIVNCFEVSKLIKRPNNEMCACNGGKVRFEIPLSPIQPLSVLNEIISGRIVD